MKARVTLRLVEIPWDEALGRRITGERFRKNRVGNVITISTTKRLETERNARLLAQNAQRKIAPLETAYVKINYVKAIDIAAILTREIEQQTSIGGGPAGGGQQQQAPGGARRIPDRFDVPAWNCGSRSDNNVVIVRDIADRIASVKELIRQIDVQTPQVVIESYIVTANQNLNRDLGIQWGYSYAASPETGNPTGVTSPADRTSGGGSVFG